MMVSFIILTLIYVYIFPFYLQHICMLKINRKQIWRFTMDKKDTTVIELDDSKLLALYGNDLLEDGAELNELSLKVGKPDGGGGTPNGNR